MKQRKSDYHDQVRHLYTAAEAERWLQIPAATVRSWARRKHLFEMGLAADGTPMYDRAHLRDLDARRQAYGRGERSA